MYKLGVFINNFTVFTLISALLINDPSGTTGVISCVLGVLVGLLAVWWVRPSMVISTAVMGGFMAGGAIPVIFGIPNIIMAFVLSIALSICGGMYQWKRTSKMVKAPKNVANDVKNSAIPFASPQSNSVMSPQVDTHIAPPLVYPTMSQPLVASESNANFNSDKSKDNAKQAMNTLKEKASLLIAYIKKMVAQAKIIQDSTPVCAKDAKTLLGYTQFATDPKRTVLLFLVPVAFSILSIIIPIVFIK